MDDDLESGLIFGTSLIKESNLDSRPKTGQLDMGSIL